MVDVLTIALVDFSRGHCFSPGGITVSTFLFSFFRALVFAVLLFVVAAKWHSLIVIFTCFCPDPGKNKKFFIIPYAKYHGIAGGGRGEEGG